MCGRYYIDDETSGEIERLVRRLDERRRQESLEAVRRTMAGDIHPGNDAPVLSEKGGAVCCSWQRWGFPGFDGRKLIFNARCESALEKPLFRESVLHRRVVIPASRFYEWNPRKEKNTFYRSDGPVLFMAGFCKRYGDGEHFVILTTAANASMKPVHERMPLILEREETAEWIADPGRAEELLKKTPCLLERKADYEQLSLF